jgi:hypothetical protein
MALTSLGALGQRGVLLVAEPGQLVCEQMHGVHLPWPIPSWVGWSGGGEVAGVCGQQASASSTPMGRGGRGCLRGRPRGRL